MDWTATISAVTASFLASFVEVVEAFTIVLAVGTVQGWRPALLGTAAGCAVLAVLVLGLGPLFSQIPLHGLQIGVGLLALLFGMRWLRKAALRSAGVLALHDENLAFDAETRHLRELAGGSRYTADIAAASTAFQGVVIEGVEVVFIVLAVGGGHGLILAASLGALAACAIVVAIGALVHRPLAQVPENVLKFAVGVMLSAFGTFWVLEGMGGAWPGNDAMIALLAVAYALVGLACREIIRARRLARSSRT
jgi:uncharacterized membrane protein